jgi:HD-GYP domain-containing protein (c-di-GMP phosphodiesterase class II)
MRETDTPEYRISNEDKATARLSELLALECGICPPVAGQIRTAAALHDLGKQKIPASILNKPGKLTLKEFEIVKTHTTLGAEC